ncbi:MAG: hypothetical protein JXR48_04135 [Candidatus Delongbacteria bacterium]|nr:hypothetical protein [Candidatus Delongbacteria bacterium]MBN2834135.1 hypothetical protein [Candidatus Delongbacteria bacterium]
MSDGAKSNFLFILFIILMGGVASVIYFFSGEVKAGTYVVRQEFFTGRLTALNEEGWYLKLGYTEEYQVSDIIWFSENANEGSNEDESISVRFNDGAQAWISGSVRFVIPTDPEKLIKLRKQFGTFDKIKKELVMQVVNEAIYLTASLMSSKESYTNRRNLFSDWAQDQAANGVFRTRAEEITTKDPISGDIVTKTEIQIMRDSEGKILRKESALSEYGIELKNFVVQNIKYPENILKQLDEQQQALMDVQKAKAMAQRAEQEAITAEKEGLANIAQAKAEQEVLKIKAVVEANKQKEVAELEAQKLLEVARLDKEAAVEYKDATLLRAEADSKKAEMLIKADGALKVKLETYENVMRYWADAYTKQRPTPDIVIGGSEKGDVNSAQMMMNLLGIKALKDLQLDLKPAEGK